MYSCSLENLLNVIAMDVEPARVEALKQKARSCENGLLSVGLKLHVHEKMSEHFSDLTWRLGYEYPELMHDVNIYCMKRARFCLVLPPVGSATAAIELVRLLEKYTGAPIFNNRYVSVQVCSPGRMEKRRAALLGVGFYLGSRLVRNYEPEQFRTTVSNEKRYLRGTRLVIYDGYPAAGDRGQFDPSYEWWWRTPDEKPVVVPRYSFNRGRTDIQVGICEPMDIENINLIASLLLHREHRGYWHVLGKAFQERLEGLMTEHCLDDLPLAPWVADYDGKGNRSADSIRKEDEEFIRALDELTLYARAEYDRLRRLPNGPRGILDQMQDILWDYRLALSQQAYRIGRGESA